MLLLSVLPIKDEEHKRNLVMMDVYPPPAKLTVGWSYYSDNASFIFI